MNATHRGGLPQELADPVVISTGPAATHGSENDVKNTRAHEPAAYHAGADEHVDSRGAPWV